MVTLDQLKKEFDGGFIPNWYNNNVHEKVIKIIFHPDMGKLHACKFLRDTSNAEKLKSIQANCFVHELYLKEAKNICDFIYVNAEATNKLDEIINYHAQKNTFVSTTHVMSLTEFTKYKIWDGLKLNYSLFTIEVNDSEVKITIPTKQN